jgi:sulfate adenylyltransferase subunit 1 (EFTu-like GTPase family)
LKKRFATWRCIREDNQRLRSASRDRYEAQVERAARQFRDRRAAFILIDEATNHTVGAAMIA